MTETIETSREVFDNFSHLADNVDNLSFLVQSGDKQGEYVLTLYYDDAEFESVESTKLLFGITPSTTGYKDISHILEEMALKQNAYGIHELTFGLLIWLSKFSSEFASIVRWTIKWATVDEVS